MKLYILTALLICLTISDNQVVIDCYQCYPNQACETYSGAAFNGKAVPTIYNTCSQINVYPIVLDFYCDGTCSDGCLITMNKPGYVPSSTCSSSYDGQRMMDSLNHAYSYQIGYDNATYDWCGCFTLAVAIIVLIVVGAVAIIAIIAFCVRRHMVKRRAMAAANYNYATMP